MPISGARISALPTSPAFATPCPCLGHPLNHAHCSVRAPRRPPSLRRLKVSAFTLPPKTLQRERTEATAQLAEAKARIQSVMGQLEAEQTQSAALKVCAPMRLHGWLAGWLVAGQPSSGRVGRRCTGPGLRKTDCRNHRYCRVPLRPPTHLTPTPLLNPRSSRSPTCCRHRPPRPQHSWQRGTSGTAPLWSSCRRSAPTPTGCR